MTKPHSDKNHDDESDSKDLHEPVDWMTYTHQQLYDMLTKGVELGSAHEVKDGWAKLSTVLVDMQTKLNTAIDNSDKGWEGESAEKARDGLRSVTTWASDTAEHAGSVARAIDSEIKNVTDAINAMPPPPAPAPPPVPVPPPTPANIAAWTVREDLMMSQHDITGAQFGGVTAQSPANPFANAPVIASGTVDTVVASDAAHRQAADVMAAFQRNSIAVDQTVPQLAPPTNPVNQNVGPGGASVPRTTGTPTDGGTSATGAPVVAGTGGQTSNTRTSSSRGGGVGRVPTGGGGSSYSRTFMPPAASAGAGGGGAGAPSSGGSAGVAGSSESVRAGAGAGAAAAAGNVNQTKAFQNPLQMGAAPMGAAPAAAGGREDEREYKHAAYLEEDDNVFGLDRKAAPPVIGQ